MTTRYLPRETRDWVGPIDLTVTIDGVAADVDPTNVRFALLPRGIRPAEDGSDWVAPAVEPGGTALGVQVEPVETTRDDGIWAQITDGSDVIILEPWEVGYIRRT